jgi:hypothetical protein
MVRVWRKAITPKDCRIFEGVKLPIACATSNTYVMTYVAQAVSYLVQLDEMGEQTGTGIFGIAPRVQGVRRINGGLFAWGTSYDAKLAFVGKIKPDISGFEWENDFGTPDNSVNDYFIVNSVDTCHAGGYFCLAGGGSSDYGLIIKSNGDSTRIFKVIYSTGGEILTLKGNLYLSAWADGFLTINSNDQANNYTAPSFGMAAVAASATDGFIVCGGQTPSALKYNANQGVSPAWGSTKTYNCGGTNTYKYYSIVRTPDNNYCMASICGSDLYIAKIKESDGAVIWDKTIANAGTTTLRQIICAGDGGFVILSDYTEGTNCGYRIIKTDQYGNTSP